MGMSLREQDQENIKLLRRTAAHMRTTHGEDHERFTFWQFLAIWLEHMADHYGSGLVNWFDRRQAVAIAEGYMGSVDNLNWEDPGGTQRGERSEADIPGMG